MALPTIAQYEFLTQEEAWKLFPRGPRAEWVTPQTQLLVIVLNPQWADLCGIRGDENVYLGTIPNETYQARKNPA